ncbi:hypothetical protein GOV08_00910 [Candidatus Woesearchaeota archaeon]|nr:hypothetical protein [Candidatus Woesearchaeota archaeon]
MEKKTVKVAIIILKSCLALSVLFGAAFFIREVNKQTKTIADLLDVDIIIIPKAAENYPSRFVVADVKKPLYLPPEILEHLPDDPKIEELTYHVHLGKPPSDCCTYIDGPIIAFEEKSDFIIGPLIAERRKNGPLTKHEILEGGAINDYLGLITDIILFNNDIKIVGHLKHSDTNFDNCVFMRIEDVATISPKDLPNFPQGSVSVIFVNLNATANVSEFTAKIKKSYPYTSTISKGNFFQGLKAFF